jgi:hypothetical protein
MGQSPVVQTILSLLSLNYSFPDFCIKLLTLRADGADLAPLGGDLFQPLGAPLAQP